MHDAHLQPVCLSDAVADVLGTPGRASVEGGPCAGAGIPRTPTDTTLFESALSFRTGASSLRSSGSGAYLSAEEYISADEILDHGEQEEVNDGASVIEAAAKEVAAAAVQGALAQARAEAAAAAATRAARETRAARAVQAVARGGGVRRAVAAAREQKVPATGAREAPPNLAGEDDENAAEVLATPSTSEAIDERGSMPTAVCGAGIRAAAAAEPSPQRQRHAIRGCGVLSTWSLLGLGGGDERPLRTCGPALLGEVWSRLGLAAV